MPDNPKNKTDLKELVVAAQGGDAGAQGELLRRHIPWLRAVLRLHADSAIRKKESVSDLVQSVCMDVFQSLDRFEYQGDSSFRNWLYAWARNKLLSRRNYYLAQCRNQNREKKNLSDSRSYNALSQIYASISTPSEAAIVNEEVQHLEGAFDKLPEDYAKVIILAQLVGLSHAEIAVEMDRSETATRVLLHRAMARLGILLDKG